MATVKRGKKSTAKSTKAKKAPSKAAKKGGTIKCGSWKAVHDFMPPGTPTLTVTGVCTVPTTGYKIKLVMAVPQGINPAILLLKKVVTPPTGIVIPIQQKIKVVYTKKTKTKYTHVTILPDGVTVKVKVVT